jgi:hypothetical protein
VRRRNFLPKCHGARLATIRCRESPTLSSSEQVAVPIVERQQASLGRGVRLDCTVMQNLADSEATFGQPSRHQKAVVAVEWFALGAHQTDTHAARNSGCTAMAS